MFVANRLRDLVWTHEKTTKAPSVDGFRSSAKTLEQLKAREPARDHKTVEQEVLPEPPHDSVTTSSEPTSVYSHHQIIADEHYTDGTLIERPVTSGSKYRRPSEVEMQTFVRKQSLGTQLAHSNNELLHDLRNSVGNLPSLTKRIDALETHGKQVHGDVHALKAQLDHVTKLLEKVLESR